MLLQARTEDRLRGRVFATEWLLIMVADALSILLASLAIEHHIVDLAQAVAILALVQIASGLAWAARARRAQRAT